ncbi:MAG: hypothetical protein HOK65_14420, partial [Crocinitomicaceae bacterium]|nr:hypothetical protein [Crocinitomicaceae bacterium]
MKSGKIIIKINEEFGLKNLIMLLVISSFFASCKQDVMLFSHKIGTCFKEVNKRYVASKHGPKEYIYKIMGTKGKRYSVSVFASKNWMIYGNKE